LKTESKARNEDPRREEGSLAQQLYRALKKDIVTCALKPGLSFTEDWLCQKYGASRTTVRDACLRLAKEDLLEWVPKKGYSVSDITIRDLNELFQLRGVLESAAAEMACACKDPERMARAEELARITYEAGNRDSFPAFLEANHEFHSVLAEMSGNGRLTEQLNHVLVHFARFSYLTMAADSYGPNVVQEHQEILDAIRRGDVEAARSHTISHMQRSKERAIRYFLS
jgi:DNA-binding GntR family transcriptional regulator